MDLAEVMDEVADRLRLIDGLRVFAYPPDSLTPPAAVVSYPDRYVYDATYGRGMDRIEALPVVVVVGRPTDRTARNQLAAYVNSGGAKGIKTVIESGTYSSFDSVRVAEVAFDPASIAGIEYMAAVFTLDIAGQGA